jgi:soluble cytochrome b562
MEEAGGERAIELLDALATLNPSEQRLALTVFGRVVKRISAGTDRLVTNDDKALKDFEEGLYADLIAALNGAAAEAPRGKLIEVVDGGKAESVKANRSSPERTPISLDEARRAKRARSFFS